MEQLSGLDAAFLGMETAAVHGHGGNVCVFDQGSQGPLSLEQLTASVAARLHLVPAFRRRLVSVPLGLDHPYWVEAPDLDLSYHVREISLARPGSDRQLADQVSRTHSRRLDRSRPLWELYLVHGLAENRFATYLKLHHCAIDGVSGNDLLASLLDVSPAVRPPEVHRTPPVDRVPSRPELLLRSAGSLATHPVRAARLGYEGLHSAVTIARGGHRVPGPAVNETDGMVESPGGRGLRAPATPFNRSVTPHRRWAFGTVPFADVLAVKRAAGTTVNDVVMALCAGALRRWLADHDALPESPLVVAFPISLRAPTDTAAGTGVKISMMIAPLPTHLGEAQDRLAAAHSAMRSAKELHGALPANLLADVTQFAMPAVVGQAARLSARFRLLERLSPFNLIVSNIPGPQQPLYLEGRRMRAYFPVGAVTDGQGLNITAISYDGALHFGVLADRELLPDVDRLAEYLTDELRVLAESRAETRIAQ